jgi:hypothetical protein
MYEYNHIFSIVRNKISPHVVSLNILRVLKTSIKYNLMFLYKYLKLIITT